MENKDGELEFDDSDFLLDIYIYEKELSEATTKEQKQELVEKINLAHELMLKAKHKPNS